MCVLSFIDRYFGNSRVSNESVTHNQLTNMLSRIISGAQSNLPPGVIGATDTRFSPRSIVVLTQNELTTYKASQLLGAYNAQPQLPAIHDALQQSTSMYFPYAFPQSTDAIYRSVLPSASRSTKDILATTTCDEVISFISNSIKATDGKSLVLMNSADLTTLNTLDACVPSILSSLREHTDNKFLFVLQGNTAKVSYDPSPSPSPSLATQQQHPQQKLGVSGPTYEGPKYVTGGSILAIAVAFILFGFFYFGLSSMLSAQGPLRYPVASNVPVFTREY